MDNFPTYSELMDSEVATSQNLALLIAALVDWKQHRIVIGADIHLLSEAIARLQEYREYLKAEGE